MICAVISNGFEKNLLCQNENEFPYPIIKKVVRNYIWNAYVHEHNEYYTDCEKGIPLWAAEIIAALKTYNDISLNLVIPYEEQSSDWTEELRDRYYSIHQKADTVTFAHKHYSEDCYTDAYKLMIEKSDSIMFFKFGNETSFPEEYAALQNKKLISVDISQYIKIRMSND